MKLPPPISTLFPYTPLCRSSDLELRGIPYVFTAYCPAVLPSPHHAPSLTPFQSPAPAGAGNRELWARDAEGFNATFGAVLNAHRASLGLAAVDDVRSHVFG